jgi:hypothetical protein
MDGSLGNEEFIDTIAHLTACGEEGVMLIAPGIAWISRGAAAYTDPNFLRPEVAAAAIDFALDVAISKKARTHPQLAKWLTSQIWRLAPLCGTHPPSAKCNPRTRAALDAALSEQP